MNLNEVQEQEIKKKFAQVEAELIRVYAQFAEKTLDAHNAWMRYEIANRMCADRMNERALIAQQLGQFGLQLLADGTVTQILVDNK